MWVDFCVEVFDLRDEKKMCWFMSFVFNIEKLDKNNYKSIFYLKRIVLEFKGWVFKCLECDGLVLLVDYVFYKEDIFKVVKGFVVGEVVVEKVFEVKFLKIGKVVECWFEMFFEVVYCNYMDLIN